MLLSLRGWLWGVFFGGSLLIYPRSFEMCFSLGGSFPFAQGLAIHLRVTKLDFD